MARWTSLLLAVAGLLALAWVAGRPSSPESIRSPASIRAPAGVDPAGSEGVRPPDSSGARIVAAPGELPTRVESAGPIEVRVVHARGGRPFPGAHLTFLDRERAPGWRAVWDDSAARARFLREHGRAVIADAQGGLRLPATGSGVLALSTPGWFGERAWERAPTGPILLRAGREAGLAVQVLDARGRPQPDVPLAVVRRSDGLDRILVTRTTAAATGLATFDHLRRLLVGDGATEFALTFAFPLVDPPRISLDPGALPGETLRLELPPTGPVRVRVLDERRRPLREVVDVILGRMVNLGGERVFEAGLHQRLVQGETRFRHVGVGVTLALRLAGSPERPPLTSEHPGPARAGAEALCVVSWKDRYPAIVARAVLEGGGSLANRRGRYVVTGGGGGKGGPPISTDAGGRFRVVISEPWEQGDERFLEAKLFPRDGEAPLVARLDLSHPLPPGDHDLGTALFRPLPAVVSGRVTDPAGIPLFGAHVRAEVPIGQGWQALRDLAATSDRDGGFTIYGETQASELRLRCLRRGYEEGILGPVRPGSSGLELVIEPADG